MNATSRSSPPSSRAIVMMPDAPPAIIPSAAVGAVDVGHARGHQAGAASETPSVAALTSATGSQSSPSAFSDDDCR